MTTEILTEILNELRSIRTLLMQQPTDDTGPNFQRSINEYPTFDWTTIGAEMIAHDRNGATMVFWHGQEYTRRRHTDYNNAVWFSRYTGKTDDTGKRIYARLITFSDTKRPAKSLPDEITDLLPTPDEPTSTNPPTHHSPKPLTPARLTPNDNPIKVSTATLIEDQIAYWNLVRSNKPKLTTKILNSLAGIANTQGYKAALTELETILHNESEPLTDTNIGNAPATLPGEETTDPLNQLIDSPNLSQFFGN